jgi:hypothetical protein
MAFSADELRVLRRALAQALQPTTSPTPPHPEAVHDYLRLADAIDETARESARLRTFLFAELVRYRAALPGSAPGFLDRLNGALDSGYVPGPDDLAALRRLRGRPYDAMLRHCEHLAELALRARLEVPGALGAGNLSIPAPAPARAGGARTGAVPGARLYALPGGRCAADPPRRPSRPVPTPGEVFPRRRHPVPPPEPEPEPASPPPAGQPKKPAPPTPEERATG